MSILQPIPGVPHAWAAEVPGATAGTGIVVVACDDAPMVELTVYERRPSGDRVVAVVVLDASALEAVRSAIVAASMRRATA